MDVFRCLDKDGITVICSRDTWDNHIVSEHPEMIGWELYVKETIQKPHQVYQDPKHPNKKIIYRPFILPEPFHTQYLRVAIKYRKRRFRDSVGYISTAFACQNKRRGDILIWEEK